jgi:aminopeptidase N
VGVTAGCDSSGARTLTLTQSRFLLRGSDPQPHHWHIPLQIRSGTDAPPQSLLFSEDQQTAAAGRCDEPLSVDAGAVGFYRTRYDAATLALDTRNFARLPDPDRIALLDDQWALVESGRDPLPTYLALAESMAPDLDSRAWSQITQALRTIEFAERGSPGHDAFTAYARALLRPVFEPLGWSPTPGETPDREELRRTLIRDLGSFGDEAVIAEARRRFAAFRTNRDALPPDDQEPVLKIVAQYADAKTFASLHALARAARDETELRRYYGALVAVRDPELAREAAGIVLSPEIPPQADALRLRLIVGLADRHQQLSWQMYRDNKDRLLKPFPMEAPLIVAQFLPEAYWSGVPTAELDAWVRSQVPKEMAANVDRGMETVRFRVAEKDMLIKAADAYVRSDRH